MYVSCSFCCSGVRLAFLSASAIWRAMNQGRYTVLWAKFDLRKSKEGLYGRNFGQRRSSCLSGFILIFLQDRVHPNQPSVETFLDKAEDSHMTSQEKANTKRRSAFLRSSTIHHPLQSEKTRLKIKADEVDRTCVANPANAACRRASWVEGYVDQKSTL